VLAVRLHVGIPGHDSTQIADVASAAAGKGDCTPSSRQAARCCWPPPARRSRSARACSRHCRGIPEAPASASCPAAWARRTGTTPRCWSVVVYLIVSGGVLLAASGQEQELVLVDAVAVFVSFLAGLTAVFRFSLRDRRYLLGAVNAAGAIAVAVTLIVNLARGSTR
jgi:hypothetical protein